MPKVFEITSDKKVVWEYHHARCHFSILSRIYISKEQAAEEKMINVSWNLAFLEVGSF